MEDKATIGNKYRVTAPCDFNKGDIVTCKQAYADYGYFKGSEGYGYISYINIQKVQDVVAGEEYVVINDEGAGGCYFRAGERVVAQQSGFGSRNFESIDVREHYQSTAGRHWWTDTSNVMPARPAPARPAPVALTPAQKLGLKVGDKVAVTGGVWFKTGEVVTLTEDDGSSLPWFTNAAGVKHCKDLNNVEPYTEPKAPRTTITSNGRGQTVITTEGGLSLAKQQAVIALLAI